MAWYQIPGPEQDVAVFTKVTCARNVASLPYPPRMDAGGARTLIADVTSVLEPNGFTDVGIAELPRTAAFALAEKQYASPELITISRPHALLLHEPCGMAVSVGGTDHMAVTALRSGLALDDAFASVYSAEALLDRHFELAFDERYGYLTADPALVGTGMSLCVVLCLPLLRASGALAVMARRLLLHGVLLCPLAEDDGDVIGSLYRLSRMTTLGLSEEDVIGQINATARHLITAERQLRAALTEAERPLLTDRLRRSQAILLSSPRLSVSEAITRLTDLRLGAAMGILPEIKVEALTVALIESMPACVALLGGDINRSSDPHDDEALRGKHLCDCISARSACPSGNRECVSV